MFEKKCSQEILDREGMSIGKVEKLIPNLRDKKEYVLHYRNLQLYLKLGLKLTKIHRALEFSQSNWLEPYIAFNTQKRTEAKNAFEKDFFKLMNNSVFGKTIENLRKRSNIQLVTDPDRMLRLVLVQLISHIKFSMKIWLLSIVNRQNLF